MNHKNALRNRIIARILVCAYSLLLMVGSIHAHHQHLHSDLCKVNVSEKESNNLHAGFGEIEHCYVHNAFSGSTSLLFISFSEISLPLNTETIYLPQIVVHNENVVHLNNPLRAPPNFL